MPFQHLASHSRSVDALQHIVSQHESDMAIYANMLETNNPVEIKKPKKPFLQGRPPSPRQPILFGHFQLSEASVQQDNHSSNVTILACCK
jgi:hypothetical protein